MKTTLFRMRSAILIAALFFSVATVSAYYDPGMQRWLNRDPLGGLGLDQRRISFWRQNPIEMWRSPNLFVFSDNCVPNAVDPLGLMHLFLEPPTGLNGGLFPVKCKLAGVAHGPGAGNQGPPSTACTFSCTGGDPVDESSTGTSKQSWSVTLTVGGNQPCSCLINQAESQTPSGPPYRK